MSEKNSDERSLKKEFSTEMKASKPHFHAFTNQQVQIAILDAQGVSHKEIAKRLGIKHSSQISDTLKAFRPTAEAMRQAVDILRDSEYYMKQVDYGSILSEAARESVKKMLQEELWPFARAPFGYDIEVIDHHKRLKINPGKAQVVKELFQTLAQGKSIYKFPGLPKTLNPYQIAKDPVYKGYHHYRGETLPEKHESLVIVDEQVWEKAQEMRKGPRPRAPYGYEWCGEHLSPVREERERIRQIFKLRLEGKGCNKIAEELEKQDKEALKAALAAKAITREEYDKKLDDLVKIDRHTVLDMIRNSLYKTGVWNLTGRQVQAEDEPFVEAKMWDEAQRIRISRQETAKEQRSQTEDKVESYLKLRKFATAPQIAKAKGISYSTTMDALYRLKWKERVVMKPFGSHGQLVWAVKKSPEVESSGPRARLEDVLKFGEPESLMGILECLLPQPLNTGELQKKTGLNKNSLTKWLRLLKEKGILDRKAIKKFRQWSIKSDFMKPTQGFLEDYRTCVV